MSKQRVKTILSPEEETLQKIQSGIFRDQYLIYNRKSTDEPENQKNSIKYQKSENIRFAFREHLPIAQLSLKGFCLDGIISEKHSGFKEDTHLIFGKDGTVQYRIERPKFYQLLQFLSNGYFKGVVILCWDRASRNKGDDTVIRKLMKHGIDFRFTLASYDKTSSGALHMDIDGMFAEHHSRVTSEKVSINIRNKREQGICTYKAPVGYLNLGEMENKPIDPVRAPIVSRMFELYATGGWSLADVARWAIDQGFTMPASRRRRTEDEKLAEAEDDEELEIEAISRPPTFTSIHKILSNRFYTGKIIGNNGEWVKSNSHKALISEELFTQVKKLLNKKKVSAHYLDRLHHPLRGLLRCDVCGRVYTPYIQKGITYFGARCAMGCANTKKNINISFVTGEIEKLFKRLCFNDLELVEIEASSSTDIALLEVKRHKSLEENERRKKRIREDLAYLRSNKLSLLKAGAYTPEGIVEKEESLNNKLIELQTAEQVSDISMHETIKDIKKLSELLNRASIYYHNAEPHEKEQLVKIVFSELTFSGNELKYKCKNGFQALESRFTPVCDQTGWLSELQKSHASIAESIRELEIIHNR